MQVTVLPILHSKRTVAKTLPFNIRVRLSVYSWRETMIRIYRNSLPVHMSGWVVALAIMFLSHSIVAQEVFLEDALDAVLKKNCLACHNQKLAEGGLNMESVELMRKGGDSGSAIDVAMPEKSLLVGRASGTVDEIMPPDGNTVGAERLNPEQLALLQKNGSQVGPKCEGPCRSHVLAENSPIPFAPAMQSPSPDQRHDRIWPRKQTGVASANRLANATPSEPAWIPSGAPQVLDAHDDFIHSMAFHPDGNRLVTGSTGRSNCGRGLPLLSNWILRFRKTNRFGPWLYPPTDRGDFNREYSRCHDQPASVQCVVSAKDGTVQNALTIPEGEWTDGCGHRMEHESFCATLQER